MARRGRRGSPPPHAYARGLSCAGRGEGLPPLAAKLKNRLRWLEGFCDGGAASRRGEEGFTRIRAASAGFLRGVRLMLQTLGCDSRIAVERPRGAAPSCHLRLPDAGLGTLIGLGFAPRRFSVGGGGGARPAADPRAGGARRSAPSRASTPPTASPSPSATGGCSGGS